MPTWLLLKSREANEWQLPSGGSLIDQQYSGGKVDLRQSYDVLIEAVKGFGVDVGIAPKKAYVSLRCSKQFAIVQPSTKKRIDIGVNLKGFDSNDRLVPSGSFNTMVTHRVRITDKNQVNAELIKWLKQAYETA